MTSPLVSIILPTYNGNILWLSESINSVLSQSYKHFELIIINDASTNNIENTILNFCKNDKRITYLKNNNNLGLTKTLNKGIEVSKGTYIARIDDDDIWQDKNKLEKQIKFLEGNRDYGLCGTSLITINEPGDEIEKIRYRMSDFDIRRHMLGSCQFAHSSVVIRKDILFKTGFYDQKRLYVEDYDLWFRIGRVSKFHNLGDYCIKYRIREGSISNKKNLSQKINSLGIVLRNLEYYPGKITGILKHIIIIFIPRSIISWLLRKLNNSHSKKNGKNNF